MQRAEESSSRMGPDAARSGLRPATAFLLLLLVLGAVAALVFLTRPTPAPTPTGTTSAPKPNFALTNEEAIARLSELDALRQKAYRTTDISLLASIYVPDSSVLELATKDLRTLSSDGVTDHSVYSTRLVEVQANRADQIVIVQKVDVEPRLVSNLGREVTSGADLIRRRVRWVLQRNGAEWLVADAIIEKAVVLRD